MRQTIGRGLQACPGPRTRQLVTSQSAARAPRVATPPRCAEKRDELAAPHHSITSSPLFAERNVMESSAASIRLRPRELDHLGPLLGFLGNEFPEIGRRA